MFEKNIKISAIIPTYNRGKTIRRAIDSVLYQQYSISEVIVIDDGSQDDTRKIVESYGDKVIYLYQENQGVSGARNRGIQKAKYEWIAFLDSDDYWLSNHIKRIVNAIEATEAKASLYFCDIQRDKKMGLCLHWERCGFKISGDYELKMDASEWALMPIQPMMIPATVIKKNAYLEIGGIPEQLKMREDTYLFYRITLLYPACAVSGCGVIATSDGSTQLTEKYNSYNSQIYWNASIFIYKELLKNENALNKCCRMYFTRSLSASYFSRGRLFFRRRKIFLSIINLLNSCLISPVCFLITFKSSVRQYYAKIKKGLLQ